MTDGPDENSWIRACLDANLELLRFIYAGMQYNNCWGLFLKTIAVMTGCILYQLKVLSVKLGGEMCQNSDSK